MQTVVANDLMKQTSIENTADTQYQPHLITSLPVGCAACACIRAFGGSEKEKLQSGTVATKVEYESLLSEQCQTPSKAPRQP